MMSRPAADPLPIDSSRAAIAGAFNKSARVILRAPTGSGKSTHVPQILLDDGVCPPDKRVVILQPRRLAARMLAARVASERGSVPGGEVGYHIRFDRVFGPGTRILFVTEGILLRMLQSDPLLKATGIILFDEFHERHLQTDLGIALARQLQGSARPDLRIGVMSATMETEQLAGYLAPCGQVSIDARSFPIETSYLPPPAGRGAPNLWDHAASAFEGAVQAGAEGDFLVFMPGRYEIGRTVEAIRRTRAARGFSVVPLHGELPAAEQDAAVRPGERPKVVVSTNVAETSLTIPGIRVVIDSGLARQPNYDPHRGINTLLIEKIDRASADQRAGRAGRTAPGICIRLWSQSDHHSRPAHIPPEIRRVDVAETVLTVKSLGFHDLGGFPWLDPPGPGALERALWLLTDLGALDQAGNLTGIGQKMAAFPLHPRLARMLLAADGLGCLDPAARIAAIAQGRKIEAGKPGAGNDAEAASDFFHSLALWDEARAHHFDPCHCRERNIHIQAAREAERSLDQFLAIARAQGLANNSHAGDESAVRKTILLGFADHLALRDHPGTLRCSILHGRRGELRRESRVKESRLIVAAEIDEIQRGREVTVILGMVTAVEEAWLAEFFPGAFSDSQVAVWDETQRRVVQRRERRFRDLVLDAREQGAPDPGAAAAILAARVADGTLVLKNWNGQVEQWISRLNFAAAHCPELELSPIDGDARLLLLEQVCHGAVSYREIKERDVLPALRQWLSPAQRNALEKLVPESIELPSRNRPLRIRYEPDAARAVISSRLQDFYDVPHARLRICGGRIPLTVELLAPSGRPAQVTGDLDAFWKTSYEAVKKELKGRYPKHEWR